MTKKSKMKEDASKSLGRPLTYCDEIVDLICNRLGDGESLVTICKDEHMPGRTTVLRWLSDYEDFRCKYARAREIQADKLAEEIVMIADTPVYGVKTKVNDKGERETTEGDMIEHRRLQVDARKWYAGKLAPKKYGDKLALGGADDLPPMQMATIDTSQMSTAALAELMAATDAAKRD